MDALQAQRQRASSDEIRMSIERHRASSVTADTLCDAEQTFAGKLFIYTKLKGPESL